MSRSPAMAACSGRRVAPVIERILAAGLLLQALAFGLSGCADSALVLAPEAADVPFRSAAATARDRAAVPRTRNATSTGARDFGLPPLPDVPAVPQPPLDTRHVYTLAELIDLAQTHNPATKVSWERARQAALGVGMVEALYLPVLTATVVGGAQRQDGSTQLGALPAAADGHEARGAIPSVSLQWLIFDFGERDALKRAASDVALSSDILFNGTHQKIIYDVARAFYEYGAARQRVVIAVRTRAESAQLFDAAQARFSHGVGTTVDVAQARQALAQAEFDLVQARGAERDLYHALLAAAGLSPMLVIQVEDPSRRALVLPSLAPIDALMTAAIARRPDIQASVAAARAARAGIDAAKADLLPKVFLAASDTYLSGSLNVTSLPSVSSLSLDGSGPSLPPPSPTAPAIPNVGALNLNRSSSSINNVTVLGGITVPLYDGGTRQARVLEARSRSNAAEATVLRLEQDAATEVVAADDALHSSVAAYGAATALVGASQTTEEAALAAYKSGAGPLTAVLEAQRALLVAQLARAQAHATALVAAATMAFSTGRLSSADTLDAQVRRLDTDLFAH